MKSIVIFLALNLCLIACKKEGGGSEEPKETLVSEVRVDGVPNIRFQYNSDNRMTKIESYKSDPADNTMHSYVNFQYNDKGHITQFTSFIMPGNIASGKAVFEYDANDKMVKASTYNLQGISPNTVQSTITYTYNGKGLVTKSVEKDKSAKLVAQTNFLYYDDGHFKERQTWLDNGGALWMKGKTSFSLPSGNYPSGLDQLRVILGSDIIAAMYSESISYLTYSAIGSITHSTGEQMSAREYNEDGTLKKQVVTRKHIKPEADDEVHLEEYIYIKQ
jgi:hypothetical protein